MGNLLMSKFVWRKTAQTLIAFLTYTEFSDCFEYFFKICQSRYQTIFIFFDQLLNSKLSQ